MRTTATRDANTAYSTTQSVMKGDGQYDDHAEIQRRAGSSGLALLASAARQVELPKDGRAMVVVDYGSATGRNSAKPVRTIIETIRKRAATVPFVIYHNDQPANDFSSLFAWLAGPEGISRALRVRSPTGVADHFMSECSLTSMSISDGRPTPPIG